MISCDVIQESLQKCHFLSSISEDEVSLEDVTNGMSLGKLKKKIMRLSQIFEEICNLMIVNSLKVGTDM